MADQTDAVVDAALSREGARRVGLVIGVVTSDETLIRGIGTASRRGAGVDAQTLFAIGSISKTFTGLLLASAVTRPDDEHPIRLDTPLAEVTPPGIRVPTLGDTPILLEHLSTHMSGLPRLPRGTRRFSKDPYARMDEAAVWSALSRTRLKNPPGSVAEYSNFGAGLLGTVLAEHSGTSYAALLAERITGPLGLADTVLEPDRDQRPRAVGHAKFGGPVPDWHLAALAGAGGIWSTAADLAQLIRTHLDLTYSGPLAEELAMTRAIRADGDKPLARAVGLMRTRPAGIGALAWHNGGTSGFSSFLGFAREAGVGVVVLSNQATSVDQIGIDLLRGVLG